MRIAANPDRRPARRKPIMISRRFARLGGFAAVTLLAFGGYAAARQDKPAPSPGSPPAAHANLPEWLAGNWVAEDGDSRTEEQWLPPAADTMVGMCRVTRAGKLGMYEFMVLEREAGSVVMWMRHYRWNLKDREPAAIRWTLTKVTENEAVFESSPDERFKNLIYRKSGASEMTASLVARDPAVKPLEFAFTRVVAGAGKP
jgi:hypothetical protein